MVEVVRVVLVVMVVEGSCFDCGDSLVVEFVRVVLVIEGVLVAVCVFCLCRVCWLWLCWWWYLGRLWSFSGCEIMLVIVVMWELCFWFGCRGFRCP